MRIAVEKAQPRAFHAGERSPRVREKTDGSLQRWQRALKTLAGGVSSGLRRSAEPYPLYFSHGCGSRIIDVDGNSYLDYTLAWGPLIFGHVPAFLRAAVERQAAQGLTFGAQHDLEYEVSEMLVAAIPCADKVCFANSGTEIVQLALRLARAATGRQKYLKFEGHYHGWADDVLVSYHPTQEEVGASAGKPIPAGAGQLPPATVVVGRWNNRESVEAGFAENPGEISAIICEPLLCNSGCIPPQPGFLEFLREITRANRALLIFDEVITGFRLALGGAQEMYGVLPDLATYAKAVGGGTPLSVLAGAAEFMDLIADGKVVHAGTLNGNPLTLAAARAGLAYLSANGSRVYSDLNERGLRLRRGIEQILRAAGESVIAAGEGAVFHVSFMEKPAREYRDLFHADQGRYRDLALALLDEGVLVLPDGRWYLSTAHNDEDVDATLAAVARAAG